MLETLRQRLAPPEASDNLAVWRERLLKGLLSIALVLGVLAAVPSALFSMRESIWQIPVADLIAIVWVATLWYFKGISYRLRSVQLLALLYLIAIILLIYIGQSSQMYLMAIPILAVLLIDLRVALWTLAINAVSFLSVGYAAQSDHTFSALNASPFIAWLVIAINLFAVNALLTLSCWFLIRSFDGALERQSAQAKKLRAIVYQDDVTGLPTAHAQRELMEQLVASQARFTVMALNLDDFLLVNNNLGLNGGNAIMAQAAQAIQATIGSQGELARASGAEFLLVIPGVVDPEPLHRMAQRILSCLETPLNHAGAIVYVTLSIGFSRCPVDSSDVEQLLRMATVALHDVKAKGGRGVGAYTPSMEAGPQDQVWLDHHLREALGLQQFALHYQPKVLLETGRATSVEALLRWMHPDRGDIPPERFISRAEATGLIILIGRWVIDAAARQAAQWADEGKLIRIAINVSVKQLVDPELLRRLRGAQTRAHGLLDIELTESCLVENEKQTMEFILSCRAMDFGVHLDDFGTGYSSLYRLGTLPLTKIKLDRAFIAPIGKSKKSDALLKAMLSIGKELRLPVVAEGVETQEQADYLRSLGVRYAQGWLYAPAMSGDECGWWLTQNLRGQTKEESAPSNFMGLT